MERWHPDIRANLDLQAAVNTTDGYSFAEVEELKNLLVLNFMESAAWNWDWALKQFAVNRRELGGRPDRHVGFGNNNNSASRGLGFGRRDDDVPF